MEQKFFGEQIERLRSAYGARSYQGARIEILWRAFETVFNHEFKEAVDECIATYHRAPLVEQIEKSLAVVRLRAAEREKRKADAGAGFDRTMRNAIERAGHPESGVAYHELLCKKLSGKLTMAQFEEGIAFLERTFNQIAELPAEAETEQ